MSTQRVALYQIATLEQEMTLESGEILPAGSQVIFVPATIAEVVRLQGQPLSAAWVTMQANLVETLRQMNAAATRQNKLEQWAMANGYDPNI